MTERFEDEILSEVDLGLSAATLAIVVLAGTTLDASFELQLSDTDVTVTACDFTAVTVDKAFIFVLVGISGLESVGEELLGDFKDLLFIVELPEVDKALLVTEVDTAVVILLCASDFSADFIDTGVLFVSESDTGIGADFLA